jgi:uncharacterized protein YcbK (DUF882 family)
MDIAAFAEHVREYCRLTTASVTSWIRSQQHNAHVGGATHSRHLTGLAVDVIYDDPPPLPERYRIAELTSLLLYPRTNHDHLEAPPDILGGTHGHR